MLIGEPPRTPYDLNFSLLGIPVRIHPFFWLAGLLLGPRQGGPPAILLWIAAVFLAILVHELGHALVDAGIRVSPLDHPLRLRRPDILRPAPGLPLEGIGTTGPSADLPGGAGSGLSAGRLAGAGTHRWRDTATTSCWFAYGAG